MTYIHLGIESTKMPYTVLQSRLKKCLGFSTKQNSFSFFSGALGLKKNKIDSTEKIKKESPREVTIFL